MSPTQRTLQHLKQLGIPAQVVERWIPQARVRKDLFNFLDIIALTSLGIVGIQVTSGANVAARLTKIRQEPLARTWLKAGGRIVVHGWRKAGPRGKRKLWQVRIVSVRVVNDEMLFEEVRADDAAFE